MWTHRTKSIVWHPSPSCVYVILAHAVDRRGSVCCPPWQFRLLQGISPGLIQRQLSPVLVRPEERKVEPIIRAKKRKAKKERKYSFWKVESAEIGVDLRPIHSRISGKKVWDRGEKQAWMRVCSVCAVSCQLFASRSLMIFIRTYCCMRYVCSKWATWAYFLVNSCAKVTFGENS